MTALTTLTAQSTAQLTQYKDCWHLRTSCKALLVSTLLWRNVGGVLCCAVLQVELAGSMLQQHQQEAAIWNTLLQKLPQPHTTTAYMAQQDLVIGPFS